MKKEEILEILPEISEEDLEKLLNLFEEALGAEKTSDEELLKIKQEEYDRGYMEAEGKFRQAEFERLLALELENAGAKNEKALRALLNLEEIEFSDGKFLGLAEQIEALKNECPYLFASGEEKPKFTKEVSGKSEKIDFSKLSYKERLKMFRDMPELYKELAR